jgi:hypothetical protein
LHTVLKRKYGARYRLRGIADTWLAGRPAATWDFELDLPAGTQRKRDVAVLAAGRGYGILVSAPAEGFDALWSQFETVLRSFTLPGEAVAERTGEPEALALRAKAYAAW